MKRRSIVEGVALFGVAMILVTGAGAAWARAPHATRTADQALNPAPRTWHVVAEFSQKLPQGNGSTEAVNQFYPRTLTIYPGDKVTFTDNATNEQKMRKAYVPSSF
jgi:plastocyanin